MDPSTDATGLLPLIDTNFGGDSYGATYTDEDYLSPGNQSVHKPAPETYFGCLKEMVHVGVPASITIAFTFCTSIIPLAMVGKLLGAADLNGASVGYFLLCIYIQYPMMGITYAIDTLCSHEFGRRGYTARLGLILQRGILLNSVMLIPLCISIYYLRPLLNYFYGEAVGALAEEFLFYSPLYLYALLTLVSFSKFLNNQQKAYIPTMALTAGVIVTPFVQYKLTLLGLRYTMLGMAITTWLQVLVMLVITLTHKETRHTLALGSWTVVQMLNVGDVKMYMKFGLPSALFVAAEASALDLSILLAASYGVAQGSAFSAIMNTVFLFAALTGGISTSACANIGRCIGADDPVSAKRYVSFALLATLCVTFVDGCILLIFFDFFMSLFGQYGEPLELARRIIVVIIFFHIGDSVQYVFQGIFSGLGKNNLGAKILLWSVWGAGIPLCFLLGTYYQLQMAGVAIGITIGILIETPVMAYYCVYLIDYQELCDEHKKHAAEEDNRKRVESGFFNV
eukprot:gene8729-6135_t